MTGQSIRGLFLNFLFDCRSPSCFVALWKSVLLKSFCPCFFWFDEIEIESEIRIDSMVDQTQSAVTIFLCSSLSLTIVVPHSPY